MKIRIIAIALFLLMILPLSVSCATVVGGHTPADPATIADIEAGEICADGIHAEFDPVTRLVFTFTVEKESYDNAIKAGAEVVGSWGVIDDDVISSAVEKLGEGMADGMRYYTLGVKTGRIKSGSYLVKHQAHLTVTDKSGDEIISVHSEPTDLYSVCLAEYSDRRQKYTPIYCYLASDGSYTRYSDLEGRAEVISSYLFVSIEDGRAYDAHEGEYYRSPYDIDYLDSVITVSMPYAQIRDEILLGLYINGEAVYYEIYKGRISLVVRV